MRSQSSNTSPTSRSSDQKKSVFDRLGRQIDSGRRPSPATSHGGPAMKRRPSPGIYGAGPEYMQSPHDPEFARYGREQTEYDWRYQDERTRMAYPRDGRHIGGHAMGPSGSARMHPPPVHYDIDLGPGSRPNYYPPPHGYHNGQSSQGIHPQALSPISISQQQKSSPKYDRHGNPIITYRDRVNGMPIDYPTSMSPPHGFLPGHIMHPNMAHDMPPDMRGPPGMYPSKRWTDSVSNEAQFHQTPHPSSRIMPLDSGRFSPISARKYQHQAQCPAPLNHEADMGQRFTRWRERRDVITNLDRETTQSSSRTDSFKSTLLQHDPKTIARQQQQENPSNQANKKSKQSSSMSQPPLLNEKQKSENSQDTIPSVNTSKVDPQDISDGEIIDDDSSDESESSQANDGIHLESKITYPENSIQKRNGHSQSSLSRDKDFQQYYETGKKRRTMEREDYSMDYETISDDEDLDDFMDAKKTTDLTSTDKSRLASDEDGKSKKLSEIELLNALGLDWANLVELAKQPKGPSKDNNLGGSALARFAMVNYLPTLAITPDLAGPELYSEIVKICRS